MKALVLFLFFYFSCMIICNGQELKKTKLIEKHGDNQIELFEVLEANTKIKDGQYLLKIKIGDSTFVRTKGKYVNNLKEGIWMDFYFSKNQDNNSLGQIEYITTFKLGLKNGIYIHLDKDSDTIASGNYSNNLKVGKW